MTAGHHRGEVVIQAGSACENIAHSVNGDGAPGLDAPTAELIASQAIEVRERESIYTTPGGGTDLCEFHEALPKACAVDPRARLIGTDSENTAPPPGALATCTLPCSDSAI